MTSFDFRTLQFTRGSHAEKRVHSCSIQIIKYVGPTLRETQRGTSDCPRPHVTDSCTYSRIEPPLSHAPLVHL